MSHPITITDATFKAEVYDSEKPVLVDFWATWRGPCRAMAPILDGVARELAADVTVAKLDVDNNPTTTASFGVQSIPTLILFKNGKPATRVVGAMPREKLLEVIGPYLA